MKAQLTDTQINTLHAFVQKKGVTPLDVQIELVDHLATDIETQLDNEATIGFEEALERSSSKFGRWGFDYFLQKAEQNVSKRQSRLMWEAFLSFFRWPRVMFTATFAVLFWYLLENGLDPKIVRKAVLAIWIVIGLCYGFFAVWRHSKMNKQVALAKPPVWLGLCGQLPGLLNMLLGEFWQNSYSTEAYAIWATSIITFCTVFTWATIEIYEHLMAESKRLYPQAFA
ncbi:MAG: hypothetical protein LCH91_12385 [Bacteroidetes bacterium]|nr:hypothetical protein [Bacteroidota bacterium]